MNILGLIKKFRHVFGTDYTQDANCQAAWLFNEGSGESLADSSQNSNNGSFRGPGEPAWDADNPAAYTDYSCDFDSYDDYIICGTHASIDNIFDNTGSVVSWINPTTDGEFDEGTVMQKNRWDIGFRNEDSKLYFIQEFTGNNGWWKTSISVNFGAWNHIAVIYNASHVDNVPTIYLAGVHDEGVTGNTPSGTRTDDGSAYLKIGDSYCFDGKISESGLFDRGLDSTEVNAIIDYGLEGVVPGNPYPVDWLNKKAISGYHCFMGGYLKAKVLEYDPLKLPDGTIF